MLGKRVRTHFDYHPIGYTFHAVRARKSGVTGVVDGMSDSQGLCYRVKHEDGTDAWYEPDELTVIDLGGEVKKARVEKFGDHVQIIGGDTDLIYRLLTELLK